MCSRNLRKAIEELADEFEADGQMEIPLWAIRETVAENPEPEPEWEWCVGTPPGIVVTIEESETDARAALATAPDWVFMFKRVKGTAPGPWIKVDDDE